ncbi:zinc-binding dehydrogenase [Micromonospora sp. KC721]|uniref:zinc-binding dehydrogenase n=1 Tax=Micromonospora sp. KC721 TaxID=2530380 RepID=UPI0010458794|nr:zinc-binding dehydrogenase [Micromonospora sp. KC721]TDB73887.1 hypothetical protein E1182_20215 [Micromonospora sp. KC721]
MGDQSGPRPLLGEVPARCRPASRCPCIGHGGQQQRRQGREGSGAEKLTPVVDRTFELADIVEAHRYLESNTQSGKIVVTVPH